jgi:hypothetical protein
MFALKRRRSGGDGRVTPDTLGFWIAAVVAAILVGMSKGGLPVIGMMAVPVLALFMSPITAAGLLLAG